MQQKVNLNTGSILCNHVRRDRSFDGKEIGNTMGAEDRIKN